VVDIDPPVDVVDSDTNEHTAREIQEVRLSRVRKHLSMNQIIDYKMVPRPMAAEPMGVQEL
jgi:hypothetical protein